MTAILIRTGADDVCTTCGHRREEHTMFSEVCLGRDLDGNCGCNQFKDAQCQPRELEQ